jgi:branched-chain amino acid transport system substrate-binding protein
MGRKREVLVGLCTLLIVLTACSSSTKSASSSSTSAGNSSATSTGSSGSTPAGAATGSTISVGFICDCTGAEGPYNALKANQGFVDSVNASGGISGHPVKLVVADTTSNPGTAISAAQTLISDHVVAILDDTNFDPGWLPTAKQAGIPVISEVPSGADNATDPNIYPTSQTSDAQAYGAISTVKNAGATNIGMLYCAEAPQCAAYVPLFKATGQQINVPLVYSASVTSTAPNVTAQCLAAQQAHVTSLALEVFSNTDDLATENCNAQGYKPVFVLPGEGLAPKYLSALGDAYILYPERPYWDTTSSGIQAMDAAFNKYEPGLLDSMATPQTAVEGWIGGLLLQTAIKAAGVGASDTVSSATVVKGLQSLQGETLGGLTAPLTYPAGQPHPVDCWFAGRHVSGTTATLLNNGNPVCIPGK